MVLKLFVICWHWARDSEHSSCRSPSNTYLFTSVSLYLGRHLARQAAGGKNGGRDSGCLLLRSPRTELFTPVEVYLEDGLEMAGHSELALGEEALTIYCSGLLGHTSLSVNRVMFRRWSWNSHLWVTLEKKLCKFIIQVSQCTGLWVSRVLLGRWAWNSHLLVTLEKRFCTFIAQELWETVFHVSRFILGRWSWNGKALGGHTG